MPIKISVYIATSMDGFIARENGNLDWLPAPSAPDGEDYGYQQFIDSVDVLVMGRHTFEKVLTFDSWPYGNKKVAVLSSRPLEIPGHLSNTVTHLALQPKELVEHLQAKGATHLYIDGGQTIQRFLKAGLLTDLIITRIPILIGAGISLFGTIPHDISLSHLETYAFASGFVQSHYRITENLQP